MVDIGNIKQPVMPLTPKHPAGRVKREGHQNAADNEQKKRQSERSGNDDDDDGIKHIDEYA